MIYRENLQFLQLKSIPMRKPAILLILFSILFIRSNSQLRVAIVGGGHLSTVIEENNLPDWNEIEPNYSGRVGFHGGFLADLPFSLQSKLFFQPGVIFYHKGRKFSRVFDPSTSTITQQNSTQYINYIDIPLNLVYKFGNKLKFIIGAGPYASFFYNGKETLQIYTQNGIIQDDENKDVPVGKNAGQYRIFNFGINGFVGIETNRIFITANYGRGLNDFYQSKDYDGSFKHQVFGGTIGVFLGKPVKIEKKIKDKDKDGIADDQDNCPEEAGPVLTNGCPDKDGDGIADKNDQCPDIAGTKALNGCPDKDGDGIADNNDKCPDIAGLAKYNGCPVPDKDKDGINDDEDQCPDKPGYARYNGCPVPDSDQDGVNDEEDNCPNVKGTIENKGCPEEVKKEIVEKINYAARRIQFAVSKSTLLPQSKKVLDEVVVILNEHADLKLAIEGHTSSDGNFNANMKLSEERATAVLDYLISKGIEASRLSSKGFGSTQPLNNSQTREARAQNRRVELKLSN